jgi:hypothetical protein
MKFLVRSIAQLLRTRKKCSRMIRVGRRYFHYTNTIEGALETASHKTQGWVVGRTRKPENVGSAQIGQIRMPIENREPNRWKLSFGAMTMLHAGTSVQPWVLEKVILKLSSKKAFVPAKTPVERDLFTSIKRAPFRDRNGFSSSVAAK